MRVLSLNFLILTIAGFWQPIEWSSKCSKLLYKMFTCFSIYLLTYLTLTHLMYVIFIVDDLESLVACSFFNLAIISGCTKVVTIITRRDRIINLIEILQTNPCKACDEEETDIQMKFDHTIRLVLMRLSTISNKSISESIIYYIYIYLFGKIETNK
jgi:hypothetical protein